MSNGRTVRLQTALSRAGITSRRKAVSIIEKGRVSVDGKVIREKGYSVDPYKNELAVDGKKIKPGKKIYILLNKPKGIITSKSDPEGRKTVFDILPRNLGSLHSVGRLDRDTAGLLLLTNDGGLTYRLTHPKFEIRKKYKVLCKGCFTLKEKERLEKGITVEGKKTSRAKVEIIRDETASSELFIEIHEGRKRQIKKMFLFLKHPVKKLERISCEFLKLGSLKRGEYRYLDAKEVKRLKEL
ncbi:MAG: pseudouridine synthase [Candidatus Omnitrophota bacterium]|nr:pseudouridine synthase [Candidatus Omnitrophota bacterium]